MSKATYHHPTQNTNIIFKPASMAEITKQLEAMIARRNGRSRFGTTPRWAGKRQGYVIEVSKSGGEL